MDPNVQRLLNDKLYDKRKQGALEVESIIRDAVSRGDEPKIGAIVQQLCQDYAYAVNQPHARNGGLIGLAAASIALGTKNVAPYLPEIVPPVLACFTDQDGRVRYYACEAMYNISKVAKGEILPFFNEIFDALSKLSSDAQFTVKNGADLLDRLIRDIVAESAASYISILEKDYTKALPDDAEYNDAAVKPKESVSEPRMAFSLDKFIPLLKERIHVISPFTRTFLVSWLRLLDSIPDLELVHYLPDFLDGLIRFLSDPNKDVYTATQELLERFLDEIKKISSVKRGIALTREDHESSSKQSDINSIDIESIDQREPGGDEGATGISETDTDSEETHVSGDWIPGEDVEIDHAKILDILVEFVDAAYEEEIQLTALRWLDNFFDIDPEEFLHFIPRLLGKVLPALASNSPKVRDAGNRVNTSLMQYIVSFSDDTQPAAAEDSKPTPVARSHAAGSKEAEEKKSSAHPSPAKHSQIVSPSPDNLLKKQAVANEESKVDHVPQDTSEQAAGTILDYAAAVQSLTSQFMNENEDTRVAALTWLLMLHKKAPKKILAFNDGTFPALLKTLSDSSDVVVTRDLQLLSQISRNSEDKYFASFMVELLNLFSTDRYLLEKRGNLIIRQLCTSLSPERIYKTLADCLEKEEDMEFASTMIQNLNNNLITAPELADLRKRLRNLESKEGQAFFVTLFRSWCHNAVSAFSLCLLTQAYEQAYNLLQIFAELEVSVNMLIQIDKLVQLLESPVFTYLRLQLLEPDRYPYLYKCLYGLLMLLPQSSAFAALKNRLNSVSNIGLLQTGTRTTTSTTTPSYERPTAARLGKVRENEPLVIRWTDLLDKFRATQEKWRRWKDRSSPYMTAVGGTAAGVDYAIESPGPSASISAQSLSLDEKSKSTGDVLRSGTHSTTVGRTAGTEGGSAASSKPIVKGRTALGNLSRLGIGQRRPKR